MAGATPQSGGVDIAGILSAITPLLFGSGKATSTTTTGSSKQATDDTQNVINQAIANSTNDQMTQGIVQNILNNAATVFAPNRADERSAGLYNSSSLKLLSGFAQGQAVGQASQAVLNFKTAQQQIAEAGSGNLLQANRITSQASRTAPIVSPSLTGPLLGSILGKSLVDKALGSDLAKSAGAGVSKFFNGPSQGTTSDNLTSDLGIRIGSGDASTVGQQAPIVLPDKLATELGADTSSNIAGGGGVSVGSSVGSDAITQNPISDAVLSGGNIGADAGSLGLSDAGSNLASDFVSTAAEDTVASGIGSAAADLGTSTAADVGSSVAENAVADTATSAGSDVAGGLASAAGWIICTELAKQGRLNKRHYIYGARVFAAYPEIGKRAYYLWAIPAVRHLRRSPDSYLSNAMASIFSWRAEYLAARAGCHGARRLLRGRMAEKVLWLGCALLAVTVVPFLPKPNLQAVQNEGAVTNG